MSKRRTGRWSLVNKVPDTSPGAPTSGACPQKSHWSQTKEKHGISLLMDTVNMQYRKKRRITVNMLWNNNECIFGNKIFKCVIPIKVCQYLINQETIWSRSERKKGRLKKWTNSIELTLFLYIINTVILFCFFISNLIIFVCLNMWVCVCVCVSLCFSS